MSVKVTAFIGSPRQGWTLEAVRMFEEALKAGREIEFEYVLLTDVKLETCRGCGICLKKGEEFCPLSDDRDDVVKRIEDSDGVIFASPVYSLQVSALMKNMLDRLAYVFHRPCFFHKSFMPIVTQGVYGAGDVLKYLETVAHFWGFKVCKGIGLTVPLDKPSPAEKEKLKPMIAQGAARFYQSLTDKRDPVPSLKDVLIFRTVRSIHSLAAGLPRDHAYFKERGWFASAYYYDTNLGWFKKALGVFADRQGIKQARQIISDRANKG